MKKQNNPNNDALFEKKEADAQKKVMKLLRKGDVMVLDQIKLEYFYLIKYLLQKFTSTNEIAKTISNQAFEKIKKRKKEIKGRGNMLDIIFEEVLIACPEYCTPDEMADLTKEMNALKDIYLQIEKIHPGYRPIVRMSFRRDTMMVMQKELNLPMEEVGINRELGGQLIAKGLKDEKKKYAEILFLNVVYDLVFFPISLI